MAPPKSKVDLYAAIRRDARAGISYRALMREHGVGFRTVEAALELVWPEPRKRPRPRGTRLDAYKPLIDQMLRVDLDAPRKQRHTVKRIFGRLVDEHAAEGVTYPMVRAYVADRRPQIKVEAGRGPVNAFIPQTHRPGAEAEVDFGDVKVRLVGELVTCYLFAMRLCYSGKAVHRVFASCGQEAFLEGHVHALSVLGGVPTGKVRYDNLKAAVARVLGSRARAENERWTAFRSHYAIEAAYCLPGIEGAHEKGGVEGQVGWFRRNHLVPVPEVASLAELNVMIEQWDAADERRRIGSRPRAVSEYFAVERSLLQPLPGEPFETGRLFSLRVDRFSQVSVPTNRYSVPVRLIGRTVRVMLHASELVVRRAEGSRPARAPHRQRSSPTRAGPLPGGPGQEARRLSRRDRSGTGEVRGQVHPGP
jgi:transposase